MSTSVVLVHLGLLRGVARSLDQDVYVMVLLRLLPLVILTAVCSSNLLEVKMRDDLKVCADCNWLKTKKIGS